MTIENKIVFTSHREGNSGVYVINADATNFRGLPNIPANRVPLTTFYDGTKIVFVSSRSSDTEVEVYLMNPDGSGFKTLGEAK